jgi:hypothetical protein
MELEEQDPLLAFAELLLQLKYGDQDVRVQNALLLEVGLLLNSNPWLNAHHLALEHRDITAQALAHVSSIKVSERSEKWMKVFSLLIISISFDAVVN